MRIAIYIDYWNLQLTLNQRISEALVSTAAMIGEILPLADCEPFLWLYMIAALIMLCLFGWVVFHFQSEILRIEKHDLSGLSPAQLREYSQRRPRWDLLPARLHPQ